MRHIIYTTPDKSKVEELEKFNKVIVGRELRMVELKRGSRNWKRGCMKRNKTDFPDLY